MQKVDLTLSVTDPSYKSVPEHTYRTERFQFEALSSFVLLSQRVPATKEAGKMLKLFWKCENSV